MRKALLAIGITVTVHLLNAGPKLYAQPVISYQPILSTGLTDPIDIAIPPNAATRIFIVQQNGLIKLWNGSTLTDFLDIGSSISAGGERGLLSMTFHPSYNGTTNRDFFVFY